MKTENFTKLIQSITGRDLNINTNDVELVPSKKYTIYRVLPISKISVKFDFVCPKNEETIIKSFITNFTKKYREPDPKKYNKVYGGITYRWDEKTKKEKEFAYLHHASNMFSPQKLMEQIKTNLNTKGIENVLCKYGFYHTNYGVGIFVLFSTIYEQIAVNKMREYLKSKGIPFKNEFSEARWVYRFLINIDKEIHKEILNDFNNLY